MINKIGIIGCGKMGNDIFNYLSGFPFQISVVCETIGQAEKFNSTWQKKQKRSKKYGLINDNTYEENLNRVSCSTHLQSLSDTDLIIESITENINLKSELFKILDEIVSRKAIITTNTSSIPIDTLIPTSHRADKFLGLHFFYPVSLKNLVEINKTHETSPEVINTIKGFLKNINRYYIEFEQPQHFLLNRLFLKLQAGAFNLHIEENISVKVMDDLVKEILFPIGIFEMMDQVGIDVIYTSALNYTHTIQDRSFYTPWLSGMKEILEKGNLGIKTGKGYYDYSIDHINDGIKKNSASPTNLKKHISDNLYRYYLEPLFEAIKSGILTKEQIEHIVKEYMDCDKSPFALAEEIGY